MSIPVITIDGPGGSGKGTIATAPGAKTWLAFTWTVAPCTGSSRLRQWNGLSRLTMNRRWASWRNILTSVSTFPVTRSRSCWMETGSPPGCVRKRLVYSPRRIAVLPAVRAALVHRQRAFRKRPGLVADGRDMGTVIFPDAKLKIFLTASAQARADRRYKQLKEKGESVNLTRLFRDIKKRDERDMSRSISPLAPAEDAQLIDSTEMSIEMVLEEIHKLLEKNQVID